MSVSLQSAFVTQKIDCIYTNLIWLFIVCNVFWIFLGTINTTFDKKIEGLMCSCLKKISGIFFVLQAYLLLACEQVLHKGTLAAEQEKEGELATTSPEVEFHLEFPCGSLWTELSDFCQSAMWKKKLKNMTFLMSSRPISILHRLFWYRYSISRDFIVANSPSFSCPATWALMLTG